MTKQRAVGPAGSDLPGQPARLTSGGRRRIAGVCAVITVIATGALGAVALRVTQTNALYTSTASPQHDTITAGIWSPAPTADTLATETAAKAPAASTLTTDTSGQTAAEDTPTATPSPSPSPAPLPPLDCGNASQYVRVVYGTSGNDTLSGGAQREVIMGLGGDDIIYGGDSGDCLVGGDGNDKLYGGTQDDVLIGGNDDGSLNSDSSQDSLDGGAGYDVCIADTGVVTESSCEAAK